MKIKMIALAMALCGCGDTSGRHNADGVDAVADLKPDSGSEDPGPLETGNIAVKQPIQKSEAGVPDVGPDTSVPDAGPDAKPTPDPACHNSWEGMPCSPEGRECFSSCTAPYYSCVCSAGKWSCGIGSGMPCS